MPSSSQTAQASLFAQAAPPCQQAKGPYVFSQPAARQRVSAMPRRLQAGKATSRACHASLQQMSPCLVRLFFFFFQTEEENREEERERERRGIEKMRERRERERESLEEELEGRPRPCLSPSSPHASLPVISLGRIFHAAVPVPASQQPLTVCFPSLPCTKVPRPNA